MTSLMIFTACEDGESDVFDPGYDYFALRPGAYVTYAVDSISYDVPVGNLGDTAQYYYKEYIDSLYLDSVNITTARIERYYKQDLDDPWQIKDIWSATRTNMRATKTEENVIYVKMGFAVSETQEWDGNAENTETPQAYVYTDIEQALQIGDLFFENTARVLQRSQENLVQRKYADEVYAYGVGMVSRDKTDLVLQIVTTPNGITSEIVSGYDVKMRAIEHGTE